MVETIMIRRPNGTMEIFILAAVSRGRLDTLYAMQQATGLQPGGLLPVIERLNKSGLLTRSEEAKRRRRTMKLTEIGEKFLQDEWKNSLDSNREVETILRGATVALFMGDIGTAFGFLLGSGIERDPRHGHPELSISSPVASPIEFLAEMRAVYEGRRRTMEAAVLEEFGEFLQR